jgi:hypothetical protein
MFVMTDCGFESARKNQKARLMRTFSSLFSATSANHSGTVLIWSVSGILKTKLFYSSVGVPLYTGTVGLCNGLRL